MNKIIFKFSLVTFSFIISNLTYSQVDKKVVNWYNACGAGMQTEKAYKKLKKRESETVIVAIIDSGIDIEHEDLKGKIWVNKDEIPDNGIDDDKNGYVDDVHGWNFLGNKSSFPFLITTAFTPLSITSLRKSCPSKFIPFIAINSS